jgi:hypothetical protein
VSDDDTKPRDPFDEARREHLAIAQDTFFNGLIAALREEREIILEHLDQDELPPLTHRYVRRGSWALLEAGADIERSRIDSKFAEMLVLIRESRVHYESQLSMLRMRILELEARMGAA